MSASTRPATAPPKGAPFYWPARAQLWQDFLDNRIRLTNRRERLFRAEIRMRWDMQAERRRLARARYRLKRILKE